MDPAWYPGLVVPAEEVLDDMLDEDDAEDFEDFDGRHDVVVKLFEDKSYILAELAHVRVLDPNKSPYIACVASDEGFIQQKCKSWAAGVWPEAHWAAASTCHDVAQITPPSPPSPLPPSVAVQQALDYISSDTLPSGFLWASFNPDRDLDQSVDGAGLATATDDEMEDYTALAKKLRG
jgi:hypothetical protein